MKARDIILQTSDDPDAWGWGESLELLSNSEIVARTHPIYVVRSGDRVFRVCDVSAAEKGNGVSYLHAQDLAEVMALYMHAITERGYE